MASDDMPTAPKITASWHISTIGGWTPLGPVEAKAVESTLAHGDRYVKFVRNERDCIIDVCDMCLIDATGAPCGKVERISNTSPPPKPARLPPGTVVYRDASCFIRNRFDAVNWAGDELSANAVRVRPALMDDVILLGIIEQTNSFMSQWGHTGTLIRIEGGDSDIMYGIVKLCDGGDITVPLALCGKLDPGFTSH